MSTTRKIEGKSSPLIEASPDVKSCAFVEGWKAPKNWSDATLIIGGKGYTEEEVSALLRRIASECHTWRDATPILLEYGLEPLNN